MCCRGEDMQETIDILMATYNGEDYIQEQIESILSQTYSNFRLIICDDGSTDQTYEILQEYQVKDDRIVLHQNKKNLGVIKNFEKLLTFVESNYFMCADQDDVWMENKIKDTYQKLIDEKADLVFTDLEVVDEQLHQVAESFNQLKKLERKIKKYEDIRRVYLYNVVTGCTILSKSKYIPYFLPLPQNKDLLHDHYIALVTYLKGGKVVYLDRPTIKYRQHLNNQVGAGKYTDRLQTYDEIRDHLIQVKISIFQTYVSMNALFGEVMQKQNQEFLAYFETLLKIKRFSLKGIKSYIKIYHNETLFNQFFYFVMFHIPCLGRIGYQMIRKIKKKS